MLGEQPVGVLVGERRDAAQGHSQRSPKANVPSPEAMMMATQTTPFALRINSRGDPRTAAGQRSSAGQRRSR